MGINAAVPNELGSTTTRVRVRNVAKQRRRGFVHQSATPGRSINAALGSTSRPCGRGDAAYRHPIEPESQDCGGVVADTRAGPSRPTETSVARCVRNSSPLLSGFPSTEDWSEREDLNLR